VVAVAPRDVEAVLDPRDAGVVGVLEALLQLGDPLVRRDERDRLGVNRPGDAVVAPARVGFISRRVSSTRNTPA
jgi:hypothetical protein